MGSHAAPNRSDSLQPVAGGKKDTCVGALKVTVCAASNVTDSDNANGVNAKVQQHPDKLCGNAT